MMNKKAIAAFAAGATLLAGFAMATPAFAADSKQPEAPKTSKDYKEAIAKALKDKTDAEKKANEFKPAGKPENKLTSDQKALVSPVDPKAQDGKQQAKKKDDNTKASDLEAAQAYVGQYNKYLDDQATKAELDKNVQDLTAKYNALLVAYSTHTDETKEDDDYTVALSAAATKLKTATAKLKDAFAKANKLYGELKAAKEKAAVATKTLADFKNAHDDMNKRDVATLAHLQKAKDDADAAVTKLEGKFSDASGKFDDAFTAYSEAFATYNTNFYAAKDHKDSLVLGYSTPENIELRKDYFQYGVGYVGSSDEVTTPGAPAGQPGAAQPGKPGAPAAGANGAAGKAGAKTEVENKNGKDKRGNTHTGTGVGVTLTALAATMLAGMGAAVRKARH